MILDLYVLSFSVYYLVVSANDKSKEFQVSQTEGFARVLASNPTALILAIFAFVFLWFVLGLACFHTFLVLTGRTTIEQLKQSFPHGSPFSRGYVQNCLFLYLRRIPDRYEHSFECLNLICQVSSIPLLKDLRQNEILHLGFVILL